MQQLFGIPVYHTTIDPNQYDKAGIIKTIEANYNVDNNRNNWDHTQNYKSNLHHMSNNFVDDKFLTVNFDSLYPLYEKEVTKFLKNLGFKKEFKYEIEICNYTCMKEGQYMKEHVHTSDFIAVHYIKFNKQYHKPTIFTNDNGYASYINTLFPVLRNVIDAEKIENSWASKYFNLNTNEDDFVVTPGIIHHFVPPFESSDELRMTIVSNIKIL